MEKYFPALKHLNLPNAITSMGMILGIIACYFLTQGNLRMAIICLFFAGVADAIDGFVAAKLNQQTNFGRHLDSFVDFFTCCIIPVWMVFDLLGNNPVIVAAMIFYSLCGLWRLSYYNIKEASKFFTGLPVPGSMMIVTITIWCIIYYNIPAFVAAIVFFVVGSLMISGIKLPKYGWWQKAMGFMGLGFLFLVIFS